MLTSRQAVDEWMKMMKVKQIVMYCRRERGEGEGRKACSRSAYMSVRVTQGVCFDHRPADTEIVMHSKPYPKPRSQLWAVVGEQTMSEEEPFWPVEDVIVAEDPGA